MKNNNGIWVKVSIGIILFFITTVVLGNTFVNTTKISGNKERIAKVEQSREDILRRLNRMENKLDKLLER